MKFRNWLLAGLVSTLAASAYPSMAEDSANGSYDTGLIPSPHIVLPQGGLKSMVFLLSGPDGWTKADDDRVSALAASGAAVVGIDYKAYIASMAADSENDCIYMISDIESLSQQVQRRAGDSVYHAPILAGEGPGGALVLAMIAQSPPATIGEAIAVDPTAEVPLTKQLCTPATKQPTPHGYIYALTDDALPAPVTVIETPNAPADGKANVAAIVAAHPDVKVIKDDKTSVDLLLDTVKDHSADGDTASNDLGLPLTELPAKAKYDTMAIFYSGDGGWRDIDSQIGDYLQTQGVPTVGVDALRYFWSKKDQATTAKDLSRIIDTYRKKWNVKNVLLLGYSFGADVIPSAYDALPERQQALVKQISLLALTKSVDYEISVSGWFGAEGNFQGGTTLDAVSKINPKLVQCIYGEDDDDAVCADLKDKGVELVELPGDHHFDNDYDKVSDVILNGLRKRLN
ncbi:virulence factor family protein [Rhizobium sp. C1]|uniref:virulence factor family protein n=1 Tax=Rhizobium sp. C1 TaxID=1349799 RepID=UPI001E584D4F|nr:AcvB/VirJ family lysyl-phosphatidylglycerol hydrolase [Rhizobium sp. C1]MCD2177733.1 virulence factor family protein [Rhizobium sp. C1]